MYGDIKNAVDLLRTYTITGTNLNWMSRIAVLMRWKSEAKDEVLMEACEMLRAQSDGSTIQYEFLSNVQAFIEHARNYRHTVKKSVLLDDFLDRKNAIYIHSYEYKNQNPEDDVENEEGEDENGIRNQ